jgi:hypothetical protein
MSSLPTISPQAQDGSPNFARSAHRVSRRAKWELALGLAGAVYIVLTLVLSLNAPLLSILFIALAVYELVAARNH